MKYFTKTLTVILLATSLNAAEKTLINDSFDQIKIVGYGAEQQAESSGSTYKELVQQNLFGAGSGSLSFSAQDYSQAYVEFPEASLTMPGDYIEVSLTIRFPDGPYDSNSGVRLGLYDIKGDIATASFYNPDVNSVGDTATGYFISFNPGASGPKWSNGSIGLGKDLGNKAITQYNAVLGGPANAVKSMGSFERTGTFGTEAHTVTFRVTRTTSGIEASGMVDTDLFKTSDATDTVLTYNTLIFGNGKSPGPWEIESLKIVCGTAN
ncbi:hypothetical protein [Cerasicoccus arenae]|uniref:Uncharacterized protein n=1 Tax=Cerasicoccus arenae TaxID=424488 RepID=A0A8J3DC95_9BACT|nr:hypothetical protein [Cerasicoccus arenae]MBK1859606.1 hypothetical protein [Cerasicoccus arenae]GHC03626.1 hypothetical protein GCM10007047_20300 [Cerasicoccus arenae]